MTEGRAGCSFRQEEGGETIARIAIGGVVGSVAVAVLAGCGGASTGSLSGTLTTGDGAPVGNTRLTLTPLEQGTASTATTDARGTFLVEGLPKGRYQVSVAYRVSGVFECGVPYTVDVAAGKTIERRLQVPIVDVAPNGTAAKLPRGRTTKCRSLADPLVAFLCQGVRPITLFALPPRDLQLTGPYRSLGAISERGCRRLVVLGRIPTPDYLSAVLEPFGWLYVSAGTKRGWANPQPLRTLPRQVRMWQDVAVARVKTLADRVPALAGNAALPDLSYTQPRAARREGEGCTPGEFVVNDWLVDVRNTGRGLGPKRFAVFIDNRSQTELRHLGDTTWTRGLAPGESVPIDIPLETGTHTYLALSSYTRLKLDPDNAIEESNEQNNELKLGYIPTLTCVPRP